jgi:hypothetical protein
MPLSLLSDPISARSKLSYNRDKFDTLVNGRPSEGVERITQTDHYKRSAAMVSPVSGARWRSRRTVSIGFDQLMQPYESLHHRRYNRMQYCVEAAAAVSTAWANGLVDLCGLDLCGPSEKRALV